MNKQEFLKTLPTLKEGFLIVSNLTRAPYVACNEETYDDEVFFYTEEAKAGEKVAQLNESGSQNGIIKVEQKSMLGMLTSLFLYNINGICIQTGDDIFHYQLTDIVRRKDFQELPEDKRPIENPGLQLAMLYFLQEIRIKKEQRDEKHLREMEEEMFVNLARGKYFIPFKEGEVEGKKVPQILCIKLTDEKFYIPLFTDVMEFQKFRKEDQELKANIIDFKAMKTMRIPDQASGFVMNPAGVAAAFPMAAIRQFPDEI